MFFAFLVLATMIAIGLARTLTPPIVWELNKLTELFFYNNGYCCENPVGCFSPGTPRTHLDSLSPVTAEIIVQTVDETQHTIPHTAGNDQSGASQNGCSLYRAPHVVARARAAAHQGGETYTTGNLYRAPDAAARAAGPPAKYGGAAASGKRYRGRRPRAGPRAKRQDGATHDVDSAALAWRNPANAPAARDDGLCRASAVARVRAYTAARIAGVGAPAGDGWATRQCDPKGDFTVERHVKICVPRGLGVAHTVRHNISF